ncbi:hypothetical protein DFH06DRAFT_1192226 [Mycena polygramma]|nr:hypothetical protein DFH06DRAFT_1192226 [Mycena polygramma]
MTSRAAAYIVHMALPALGPLTACILVFLCAQFLSNLYMGWRQQVGFTRTPRTARIPASVVLRITLSSAFKLEESRPKDEGRPKEVTDD